MYKSTYAIHLIETGHKPGNIKNNLKILKQSVNQQTTILENSLKTCIDTLQKHIRKRVMFALGKATLYTFRRADITSFQIYFCNYLCIFTDWDMYKNRGPNLLNKQNTCRFTTVLELFAKHTPKIRSKLALLLVNHCYPTE